MRYLLLFFCIALTINLKVTMLLERIINPVEVKNLKFLVSSILNEYNRYLTEIDIQLEVENIYDYSSFSKMQKFKSFSLVIGQPSLNKRIDALRDVENSLIIVVSTLEDKIKDFADRNPCRSRLFIKYESDLMTVSVEGIIKWIETILKTKIPRFDALTDSFIGALAHSSIRKDIKICNAQFHIADNTNVAYAEDKNMHSRNFPTSNTTLEHQQEMREEKISEALRDIKGILSSKVPVNTKPLDLKSKNSNIQYGKPLKYGIKPKENYKEDIYKKFRQGSSE